jgi:hypothetical protein
MPEQQLSQLALKRLMRAHARVEGAQQVAQAAEGVYRTLASNFEDALRGACEDASIELPPAGAPAQIHVDWNTGEVTWHGEQQPSPNGLVMPEIGAS